MAPIMPEGHSRVPRVLRNVLAVGLVAGALALSEPSTAADAGNFQVQTAEDFVKLCRTQPSDPDYVAAIHFCHGFAVGAFRYYQAAAAASPADRYVCPPDPPPSRNQVMAAYLNWVGAHPEQLKNQAVDSIFQYLGQTYPCKQ